MARYYISVDIEANGPIPGDFSMIEIGAVQIDPEGKFDNTFYGCLKPISEQYDLEALQSIGTKHEQTLGYDDPHQTMINFAQWLNSIIQKGRDHVVFCADNNGFDFMFVHWYFIHFLGYDPFGYSSKNINNIYQGLTGDINSSPKGLKTTKHTHNPVDDAMGNAEAFYKMIHLHKLKINLK